MNSLLGSSSSGGRVSALAGVNGGRIRAYDPEAGSDRPGVEHPEYEISSHQPAREDVSLSDLHSAISQLKKEVGSIKTDGQKAWASQQESLNGVGAELAAIEQALSFALEDRAEAAKFRLPEDILRHCEGLTMADVHKLPPMVDALSGLIESSLRNDALALKLGEKTKGKEEEVLEKLIGKEIHFAPLLKVSSTLESLASKISYLPERDGYIKLRNLSSYLCKVANSYSRLGIMFRDAFKYDENHRVKEIKSENFQAEGSQRAGAFASLAQFFSAITDVVTYERLITVNDEKLDAKVLQSIAQMKRDAAFQSTIDELENFVQGILIDNNSDQDLQTVDQPQPGRFQGLSEGLKSFLKNFRGDL